MGLEIVGARGVVGLPRAHRNDMGLLDNLDLPTLGDGSGATQKPEKGSDRTRRRKARTRAGKSFREAVRTRDGYRCTKCGRRVRRTLDFLAPDAAHVHHIVPRNVAPERRFDPTNAVTWCSQCHLAHHHQKGQQ